MPVTNTETGMTMTPELRLFSLVNDSSEFSRAVNIIGTLVAESVLNNRVEEFGFTLERGRLQHCHPWTRAAIIRVEVFQVRGHNGTISFNDPQRRVLDQRVTIKEVGDSEWKSWVTGSINNETICTDLGLQAAVNKSVEHLLREIAGELVTCDK